MKKIQQGQNPWEALANGIVAQACYDYRAALARLKRQPRNKSAKIMKEEVERFFRSGWYRELTDVDPEFLMRKLKEEAI